jgi:hypothetical protein
MSTAPRRDDVVDGGGEVCVLESDEVSSLDPELRLLLEMSVTPLMNPVGVVSLPAVPSRTWLERGDREGDVNHIRKGRSFRFTQGRWFEE